MAGKQGTKDATTDDIMGMAEIKQILAMAKRGSSPSCVIGLTKDKEGVVLLDKKKKPKQLRAILMKMADDVGLELDATTLRHGRATVNREEDSGLLTLKVNKDAPGALGPKILKSLKKAGFTSIEIIVDEGMEDDSDESEPDADDDAPDAPVAPDMDTPAPDAPAPSPAPAAEAPAEVAAKGDDVAAHMAALTRDLTDLVKRMMPIIKADPSQMQALRELATEAQASLKTNDPDVALLAISKLDVALDKASAPAADAAGAAGPAAAPPPNMASFAKARQAWVATRQRIEGEIDKLHKEMTSVYKDHGFGADLDKFFHAKVEPVLTSLDDKLAHKLDEVAGNADPAQHAKLVSEAQQILKSYEDYVSKEPIIAKLDENPFVPLQIEKTLMATLTALGRAIV